MGTELNTGLIIFVLMTCCWYAAVLYYGLRSWKSVFCYTVLPVAGICAALFVFAGTGIQHTVPGLFLGIPLLGAALGVYVGYRIDNLAA